MLSLLEKLNIDPGRFTEPNGLISNILASAIFAIAVLILRRIWWTIRAFIEHDQLYGEWNHYFRNYDDGQPVYVHDTIKIKRGFLRRMKVLCLDDNKEVIYVGYALRERNFLVMYLKFRKDREIVFQRFAVPPIGRRTRLLGLSSAQDYSGLATVHASIMSRDEVSEAQFNEIVKLRIKADPRNRIMAITAMSA